MTDAKETRFDFEREARIGLPEAIFCEGKTVAQIDAILDSAGERGVGVLLTRLNPDQNKALRHRLDYDSLSRTGLFGDHPAVTTAANIAIVTAGTADLPVARETARTLAFFGLASTEIADVGVAGLWRLLERTEELRRFPLLICIAGMEGALFSVLAGLVPGMVIAVPTSRGYGVARGGETALHAALTGCAPGVLVTNIDNGYGAACAARRMLLNAPRLLK